MMNLFLIVLVVFFVILALWKIISDKKKGKDSCGNNCADCPYSNNCDNKNG